MKHFYQNIPNWFNYPEMYDYLTKNIPDGGTFVEVGSFVGGSAAYFAVEAINLNKKIKIHIVDNFQWWQQNNSPAWMENFIKNDPTMMWKTLSQKDSFVYYTLPVKEYLTIHENTSAEGSKKFENLSLDTVFIDADHDYEPVKEDLNAWWPKIKPHGIISGHDYLDNGHPGVKKAVDEFFENLNLKVNRFPNCFYVVKPS